VSKSLVIRKTKKSLRTLIIAAECEIFLPGNNISRSLSAIGRDNDHRRQTGQRYPTLQFVCPSEVTAGEAVI
jgi:hypothetical protein